MRISAMSNLQSLIAKHRIACADANRAWNDYQDADSFFQDRKFQAYQAFEKLAAIRATAATALLCELNEAFNFGE